MALQVGALCYATSADAAAAACSAHVPSTSVQGANIVTLSCAGVDGGSLLMQTQVAPVDGSASAATFTQAVAPSFAPCVQGEWFDYVGVVFGLLLGVFGLVWGYRRLLDLLYWGRGEAS